MHRNVYSRQLYDGNNMLQAKILRFIVVLILTIRPSCNAESNVNAEFLERPKNQYILEGTRANISCRARAAEAYWIINTTTLSLTHCCEDKSRYEEMGIVFMDRTETDPDMNSGLSIQHLWMIVPACASSLVIDIHCVAIDTNHHAIMSGPVNVFVFKTLRPHEPNVSVFVEYHLSSMPLMTITITGRPLWPSYEISEFIVNITNGSDGSFLYHTTIPNNASESNNTVAPSLFESAVHHCYSLTVSVSAVSSLHGESEATQTVKPMFRVPGTFADQSVQHKVLFYSNGSLSHVSLQIQLPDVCSYQPINYTINTTIEDGEDAGSVLSSGPHIQNGSGMVTNDLSGLKKNQRYSVRVQMVSVTGSIESNNYHFNTTAVFESQCSDESYNAVPTTAANVFTFKVAMGISLGIAVLAVIAFTLLLLCFCLRCIQSNRSTNRAFNSMVPNPIYAGPVYDIIQPRFDKTANAPPHQAMPTPLSHNGQSMDAAYSAGDKEQDLELNNDHHTNKSLSSNFYSSDMVAGSMTKLHLSTKPTSIKSNGEERNKLHLTLPTNGEKDRDRDAMKVEETYVEMSKTTTVSSVCTKDTLV